jgi:hypothetical protein
MAEFTFPESDLDRVGPLAGTFGSFWTNVFTQKSFTDRIALAKGHLEKQTMQQMQELFDSVSRLKVPVFHRERWHLLSFLESERNQGKSAALLYDGEADYDATSGIQYGVNPQRERSIWDLPELLVDVKVLSNRITDSSMTMIEGIDFQLQRGGVVFHADPFDHPMASVREIFVGNEVVDREIFLWAFMADFDFDYLFEQFGYVIESDLGSSEGYKKFINAVFDALVHGSTERNINNLFEALTGATLVIEAEETVENLLVETGRKLAVTDKHVYQFDSDAAFVVTEGQKVFQGDSLADTLQFFEFNRGQCPTAEQVRAVALGPGFVQDLVFENKDVPLVVETDEDGFTKVSWELGGFPGDVEKFFDDMHERGVAEGETLAHLLDERTNKVGEPQASNLPADINPFEFLCQNVFRNNAHMVKVRTTSFGPDAVGMQSAKILRKVHQPWTAIIIFVELAHRDDPIIMDGPGSDTRPGFEESAKIYLGLNQAEAIHPATFLSEHVRIKQIGGSCQ